MAKINWGIIGCGNVTEVKSGPAFQKIEESSLVAVMRRTADKARDYARRHGVPKWTDKADEVINDPDVNAVYIATPPDSHADYTLKVAQAGKPVYVEKPMARNYEECEKMVNACEKAGVPLFVAYYRRCLPSFLKVKGLVESGAIGDVRFVTVSLLHTSSEADGNKEKPPWRVIPEIAGAGYFFDLGSHQLDVLDFLLGPVKSACGRAVNQAGLYPAEDAVAGSFIFESGAVGTGLWCFTVPKHLQTDAMEIVGSRGKIVFPAFARAPVRLITAKGAQDFDLPPPEHVQQPLIRTIVDELLGRGKCPSTGVSGARTSYVMDQIISDWKNKK